MYWKENDGKYVLSKTKVSSAIIFLLYPIVYFAVRYQVSFYWKAWSSIIYGTKFSILVYIIGYLYHGLKKQNKTLIDLLDIKFISILVLFISTLFNSISKFEIGIICSICIFVLGNVIVNRFDFNFKDKLSYNFKPKKELPILKKESFTEKPKNIPKNAPKKIPVKKVQINKTEPLEKSKIHPSLLKYKKQVDNLIIEFESKEDNARMLIEKRFEPPQLTYTKFISSVDKSCELFNNQVDAIMTMINLASEETESIDLQIEKNINVLKLLIDKLDKLSDALVVNIGKSKTREKELSNFMEDMEDLIGSVESYK